MCVNHCRVDTRVPKQLLHCPDVIATFQQVRRKRMAKRMAGRPFIDTSLCYGNLYGA